jgi:hypothetical protein
LVIILKILHLEDFLILSYNNKRAGGKVMKRFILFSLVAILVFASTSALAANFNRDAKVAIKVDWLTFTDDLLEDTDSDEALYVAIDMRSPLTEFLDIGMEIGYTNFSGDIVGPKAISGKTTNFVGTWENDINYIPIEVNLSYSRNFGSLVYTLGAGLSGNYVTMDINVNDTAAPFTLVDEESAWLKGAQAFIDLSYDGESYFFGLDGKYQVVEDQDFFNQWLEVNFSNFRTGIHIGKHF